MPWLMARHRMRTRRAFLPFPGPFRSLTPSLLWQGKQKAGVRLCHGIWGDFPHSDVWYEPGLAAAISIIVRCVLPQHDTSPCDTFV